MTISSGDFFWYDVMTTDVASRFQKARGIGRCHCQCGNPGGNARCATQ